MINHLEKLKELQAKNLANPPAVDKQVTPLQILDSIRLRTDPDYQEMRKTMTAEQAQAVLKSQETPWEADQD